MMDPSDLREELHHTLEELQHQRRALFDHAEMIHMDVWNLRLPDGSWPMLQLVVAKAQVLSALTRVDPAVINISNFEAPKQ